MLIVISGMSSQTERRGSKSSHHHVRPPLGSMEEITLETGSKLLRQDSQLFIDSKARKEPQKSNVKRISTKRGSMQPSHKEKKISMDENDLSTGNSYCDKLIRQINDGNTNRLEDTYALKEKIGEGAFAKVYKAVHKDTGKKYALKIISLDTTLFEQQASERKLLGTEEAIATRKAKIVFNKLTLLLKSIDTEAYVMKRVEKFPSKDRKSLVSLKETMANKYQVIFVMELLSGGELFERVAERGEYSETDAAYLMKKVMKGIRALHQNGIVHRDLKPENIVFDTEEESSRIKITDFGLAFEIGKRDIFDNSIVGSPSYIAPEILTHKLYSSAGDIWAMGCILFILLVGGPPFAGATNDELFENIKKGKYDFPQECEVSDLAKDLIKNMLTMDPSARYTATQVLKHPWINKKAQSAQLKHSFNQIKAFNARRRLKKFALAMVVNSRSGKAKALKELLLNSSKEGGFTGAELHELRNAWFEFADDQLRITLHDFQAGFEKTGIIDLPYKALFEVFAKDKDVYSAAEICVGFSTVCLNWKGQDALRYCFDTYDTKGEGKISKDDVRTILRVVFGEKQLDKVAGGMNSVLNSILRKKPNVSFEEFSDAVIKNGGDWNVKQKLLDPMASIVKSMSKIGMKQMSRISTNVSLASGNVKRSMTRIGYSMEESTGKLRASARKSLGKQLNPSQIQNTEAVEYSLDNFPQNGTLPRALVKRDKKTINLRMKSNPRNQKSKKFLNAKFFRFSSGRPKSSKRGKSGREDRKSVDQGRKGPRKAYLIRRVSNDSRVPQSSNLIRGDQACKQEYDLLLEWTKVKPQHVRDSNLLNSDSFVNPRESLKLQLKGKLATRITKRSQASSDNLDDSDSEGSNI